MIAVIRLTADQLAEVKKSFSAQPAAPGMALLGVPVVLVDRVEDSTPFAVALRRWYRSMYGPGPERRAPVPARPGAQDRDHA